MNYRKILDLFLLLILQTNIPFTLLLFWLSFPEFCRFELDVLLLLSFPVFTGLLLLFLDLVFITLVVFIELGFIDFTTELFGLVLVTVEDGSMSSTSLYTLRDFEIDSLEIFCFAGFLVWHGMETVCENWKTGSRKKWIKQMQFRFILWDSYTLFERFGMIFNKRPNK